MARPDKAAAVAELSEQFSQASGAVLTDYRGLTVTQLKELRRALGDNATYAVVKNTLTKIAARNAGITELEEMLVGPSAIAFITGDVVEAAKGLRDFARVHHALVIKGGVLDGLPVSTDEISAMADLESREVLLAKLAGALQASLQNAAYMFNAPLAQAARAMGALQSKLEQEPSLEQAQEPVPAQEPAPAEDPVQDRVPEPAQEPEPPQEAAHPEPEQTQEAELAREPERAREPGQAEEPEQQPADPA